MNPGPKNCEFLGRNFREGIFRGRNFRELRSPENLSKESEHFKNQRTLLYIFRSFNFQKWVRKLIRTFQIDKAVSQFCLT